METDRERLRSIRTFPSLVKYLRDELDWPIEAEDFDDLMFEWEPEELGIDVKNAAKIESIKQLRPLQSNQPWGIFFAKFEPKRLPVVVLRRILRSLVITKRQSARRSEQPSWHLHDLLFISSYGQTDDRVISFANFSEGDQEGALPTLRVLAWDDKDTVLHLGHAHETLKEKLHWPDDTEDIESWRNSWSSAFTLRPREVIRTSKKLAVRMAALATQIRNRANTILAVETENGPLRKLMAGFKEALIHDLSEDDFADTYAQTITYGLFTAAMSRTVPGEGTALIAENLSDMVPLTNPFLKELLGTFLEVGGRKGHIDFDELGINDVVQLLLDADLEAVKRDFGDLRREEDPVIHFYELFLKEYDRRKKIQRGVFYTPQPVVSYIVRSVDELLKTEFGLEDGLADTTTWGEMIERNTDLKLPTIKVKKPDSPDLIDKPIDPATPFVQILDPATGTATFLVEVIDVIHKTMVAKWRKAGKTDLYDIPKLWNEYVPKHLLPRLYGYELMMAPYTIAHMKVGLKLFETGYQFQSDQRARIYLTNTLEPPQDPKGRLAFAVPALAHEAQAVNSVKRKQQFTVILGNPPYSGESANATKDADGNMTHIGRLMRDYFMVDGMPLGERTSKWLQDDYVKFFRFAQYHIDSLPCGILCYITNHGYLDNPTFRGMRQQLTRSFPVVAICDLHGNAKKKEQSPDGSPDENVFDILVGVAIGLFARVHQRESRLSYGGLWGLRSVKYQHLFEADSLSLSPDRVDAAGPTYLLRPQCIALATEYEAAVPVTEIFPVKGNGMTTARDHVVIDFEDSPIAARVTLFRDSALPDTDVCAQLGIPLKKQWDYAEARRLIQEVADISSHITTVQYRPLDFRRIFYHDSLVWRTVRAVMRNLIRKDNVSLTIGRAGQVIGPGQWNILWCSRHITEFNMFRRGGNCVMPLYVYPDPTKSADRFSDGRDRHCNMSSIFTRAMCVALNVSWLEDGNGDIAQGTLGPMDVIAYIYGQLHSTNYRSRYDELIRLDFPRVFFVSNLDLFEELRRRGASLLALHLMESPLLDTPLATYDGPAKPHVEKVSYSDETVWLDKAMTCGFKGVPEDVWNFHIGGYQVCEKWLKDRQARGGKRPRPGRVLTEDDIRHYEKIVVALHETIRLMGEIDEVIEQHGGWPDAFITDPKKLKELKGDTRHGQ